MFFSVLCSYIVHADEWRSSSLCQAAGVLATVSSEVSVFMLTTITVERAATILSPFKFGQMPIKRARCVVTVGWIVSIGLATAPLSKADIFGDSFYGRTG